MHRESTRWSAVGVSLLAGVFALAANAAAAAPQQHPGAIGIRLVNVPADSRDRLAQSYVVEQLAPGTSVRRQVEISNTTGESADVSVYPAAAGLLRGNFRFAPGVDRNELANWTSVDRSVVRVPPGGKDLETVTISVPKQASAGERYAVVWAAVAAPAPAGGGVTLVNRVGIRMYISIGKGGHGAANFSIGALVARRTRSGDPLVVASVRNSGKRTLDISGKLTLRDGPGGLRAGPYPVELATALAPGGSELATVKLDQRLPRGPWRADLRLAAGALGQQVHATIRFPATTGTPASRKPHANRLRLSSALAAAALSVLLAAVAALLLVSRRRELTGLGPS